jgi:hypothetical protein
MLQGYNYYEQGVPSWMAKAIKYIGNNRTQLISKHIP